MADTVELSVVLPVHRNRETLPELARRVRQTLQAHFSRWRVIFVDDACPEGCGELLDELAVEEPRFSVIHLPRNQGQAKAVRTGLAASESLWTVVMDADLQDPPEAIPALVARATQGSDGVPAVFAGRRGRYQSGGRMLTSRLFKRLLQVLVGLPAQAGAFCLLHRDVVARLLACSVLEPHVGTMVAALGVPLAVVPVPRAPRPQGGSAYTTWRRLRFAARILVTVGQLKWRYGGSGGRSRAVRNTVGQA